MKGECLSSFPQIIETNDHVPILYIIHKTIKYVETDKNIPKVDVGYMPKSLKQQDFERTS